MIVEKEAVTSIDPITTHNFISLELLKQFQVLVLKMA